ncbi:hypothetical protein ACFSL6_18930 [Paenibacillus thailandensis]|uniref:Uncharacterized protein n=1 Tax=Paenibacillus thailandensis TaxID=393250 RepID=A0ABW5QSQ6_9BACL
MQPMPSSILQGVPPGTNMFVWFDSSGFLFAKFEGLIGNTAIFLVGGSLFLRVDLNSIKAVLT